MLRDGAGQVSKGQITRDPVGHIRDVRLPPEGYKEPLVTFRQWKDMRKSAFLKDHLGGEKEGS